MLLIVGTEGSTVVNGSIYKALEGLDKLSAEIKEHGRSGEDWTVLLVG